MIEHINGTLLEYISAVHIRPNALKFIISFLKDVTNVPLRNSLFT